MTDVLVNQAELEHLVLMAEFGQRVANLVAASDQLGHSTLRGTLVYTHGDHPISLAAKAVVIGKTEGAVEALARIGITTRQAMSRVEQALTAPDTTTT
ncbi:hypothetical protein [Streptomyces sp.]|uniref:hypothetical protein n=1 Tax=Streptomyces sp. TaxID=1931 RepID=UPI002F9359A2